MTDALYKTGGIGFLTALSFAIWYSFHRYVLPLEPARLVARARRGLPVAILAQWLLAVGAWLGFIDTNVQSFATFVVFISFGAWISLGDDDPRNRRRQKIRSAVRKIKQMLAWGVPARRPATT